MVPHKQNDWIWNLFYYARYYNSLSLPLSLGFAYEGKSEKDRLIV